MHTTPCIPQPFLAQFVSGKLEAARLEEIASHVDQCETCQDTVIALAEQSDTFVAELNAPRANDPFESEDALRQGIRRMLAAIRHPARSNGSPPQRPLAEGQPDQIGPYRIEERLGVGGMGTVFRATHMKLKRSVALKVLPADRWAHAASISRFEREMEAIGQLDHPHIVRASDAGEDRGMHYLVMEYVDGLDLSRLVRRLGPLPVADACELARQAAVGLQHAHDHGLVHRDIKPSNLMLAWERPTGLTGDAQPRLKILDLGLALLGDEHLQEEHELTTVGQLMGTLDYMSPEQGVDSHAVDLRTDIYGLGATLFKLLTGRAPYADAQFSTLLKKMTALATKPAPSLASVRDDLPSDVVKVVDRMLSRDPDQRPATAREVAESLAPLAEGANLTMLLQRGQDEEQAESRIASVALPLGRSLSLRGPEKSATDENVSQAQAVSRSADRDGRGRARRWLIAAAAGFVLLAAGIIIRVATDYGEVVVKSDDPNARVVVKRSGEKVNEIRIEQRKGVAKIRTGDYEIELAGETSELMLIPKDKKIRVARGEQVQVEVRRSVASSPAVTGQPTDLDQPKYGGQPYSDWLSQLRSERQLDLLYVPIRAMGALGHGEHAEEAASAVLEVMRIYGSRQSLAQAVRDALYQMEPVAVTDAIRHEIEEGNARSRAFLIWLFVEEDEAELIGMGGGGMGGGGMGGMGGGGMAVDPDDARPLHRVLSRQFPDIAQRLLQLADDRFNGEWSLELLINLCSQLDVDYSAVDGLLPRLQKEIENRDQDIRRTVRRVLAAAAPQTPRLAEVIARDTADEEKWAETQSLLEQLGKDAAPAVPTLTKYLEQVLRREKTELNFAFPQRNEVIQLLGHIGPSASSALPILRRCAEALNSDIREAAFEAIWQIDPDAVPDAESGMRSQDTAEHAVEDELEKDSQYFQLAIGLRELDQQIRAESKRYGPEHPQIKQLTDERAIMQQRFEQRRSELVPRIRDRLQRLASEEPVSPTADQPPEIQPGVAAQDEPRYDGKTLEQWFAEMEYERKPERLEDALRAVSAMITHPANQEKVDLAIQSIFQLARQYGLRLTGNPDPRTQLLELAWFTIFELPTDRVAAGIVVELEKGNLRSRQFLFWLLKPVLGHSKPPYNDVMIRRYNVLIQLNSMSADVFKRLIPISHSDNEEDQAWAIEFLAEFCNEAWIDPTQIEGAVPWLQDALSNENEPISLAAAKALVRTNAKTDEVAAALTRLLQSDELSIQIPAVQLLGSLGPRAEVTVPQLAKLLQRNIETNATAKFHGIDIRVEVIKILEMLGPAARAAFPVLKGVAEREIAIPVYVDGQRGRQQVVDLRDMAREAIAKIEPDAAASVPANNETDNTKRTRRRGRSRPAPTVAEREREVSLDRLVKLAQDKVRQTRVRFEAGEVSLLHLLAAMQKRAEASLQRAGDNLQDQLEALDDLVKIRQEIFQGVRQMHDAGTLSESKLTDAEQALLEAQLRQKTVRQKVQETK